MPENEGCQSTRFPNVIAKNTVYVGQTKDAPRNKCASKACAERGSPNHPASGTVEALALIAKYFVAGESSTIAYLSGTLDGDATEPIVIPPWVSMIGLIAGAAILSSPYGYVLGDTAIAGSAVQVREFIYLQQRIDRILFRYVPYYVKPYLTAAYSVLKGVELILDNVTVTVAGDALSLSTSNLSKVKATITSSTFVSSTPGATAMSLLSTGSSTLSATLTENLINGKGTLIEVLQASSLGSVTLKNSYNKWIQTGKSSMPVQIFRATSGTMSTSYDQDYVEANNPAGIPAVLTEIGGTAVTHHQGNNNTTVQLGDGDVFDEKYMDESESTITVSRCKQIAPTGTVRKLLVTTSKHFEQSCTNMHIEQTEDTPMPLKSSEYSGTGTAKTTSNGSTYVGRTLGGAMSQNRQNTGKKTVNTSNLNVSNPNGDISSLELSGDAWSNRSSLGTIAEANGTWKSYSLSDSAILQSRDASAQVKAKQLLRSETTEDATASHIFQGSVLNAVSDDVGAFDLVGNIAFRVDSSELQQIGKASLISSAGTDITLSGSTLVRTKDDVSQKSLLDVNGGSFQASASNLSVGNGTLLNAVGNTAAKIETSLVSGGADADKATFQIVGLDGNGLELTSSVLSSTGTMVDATTDGSPVTISSAKIEVAPGQLIYDCADKLGTYTQGSNSYSKSTKVSMNTNVNTLPNSVSIF